MTPPLRGPWARCFLAGGILLLLGAASLPTHAIVRSLAPRYNTIAGFRSDYVAGLQTLRLALAANGLLLLALPWLLARCRPAEAAAAPAARREWRAPGLLYGISFALSIPGLFGSFQDDEWRVLEQYVRHGPLVILTRGVDTQPLYALLSWPFVALFGMGEVPVRLPALLLTPLAPALLFLLLRRDHPPRASWMAALPLAAAPFLLQYANEGRAYGPLASAVLALALLHRPMTEGRRAAWASYVAVGIAAVFLHLFAAAAVVALAVTPLLRRGETAFRTLAATLAIGGASFLLYAPTLPQYFAYSAIERGDFVLGSEGPVVVAGALFVPASSPILILPFLAAFAVAAARWRRLGDLGTACLTCGALLAVLLLAARSQLAHRFFTPAFALAWIPIGAGLAAAFSRPRQGVILWAAVVLATAAADVGYARLGRRDYRGAARELQRLRAPGETLAVRFDGRPLVPYLEERLAVGGDDEVMSIRPDWIVGVDLNLPPSPAFASWVESRYDEAFRLPSTRGAVVGFRRRR